MTASDELFAPAGLDWCPISSRYIHLQTLTSAVLAVAVFLAGSVGALMIGPTVAAVAAPILALAGLLLVVVARRRARTWRYALRSEDLFLTHGLMFRELVAVPYGRMQVVEVSAGPLARAFGLATVQLVTASPKTGAQIPGLDHGTAVLLRDRLAEQGEAHASGL